VTDGVRRLNDLPDDEARATLRACCASSRWVERMLSQRPFKDRDEVFAAAERVWWTLAPDDWLEAFRGHPRIGERAEGQAAAEQAGAGAAREDVKAALAVANRDYEARFGYIYIVCASGKSGEDLLARCRARLGHAPAEELKVAAGEQLAITRLRLEKVLTL